MAKFIVKNWDNIINLGDHCSSALFLAFFKLRKFSSPFDWIAGISEYSISNGRFHKVSEILLDEFKDFFRYEDFEILDNNDIKHLNLINKNNGYLFGHDFPIGKSIEQSYVDVKQKYDRRIERVLTFLRTKNSNNLLFFSDSNKLDFNFDEVKCHVVKDFYKIKTFFSDSNISLVYFFNDKNDKSSCFNVEEFSEDIVFVRFKQVSDDFIDIYYKYFHFKQFIGQYLSKVELSFLGKLLMALVNLVPVKSLRAKLRQIIRYGFVSDKFNIVGY